MLQTSHKSIRLFILNPETSQFPVKFVASFLQLNDSLRRSHRRRHARPVQWCTGQGLSLPLLKFRQRLHFSGKIDIGIVLQRFP